MFRETINNSDLVLKQSYLFGTKWRPYRNLSEEVRVLKDLERDALKKAAELTRYRTVAEANVKMDTTVLTHQLLTNSEASLEFPNEPSILEERDGVKYSTTSNNKHGASSNKGGSGQQQSKGTQSSDKQASGQQGQHKQQQQSGGKGQRTLSMMDLMKAKITLQ